MSTVQTRLGPRTLVLASESRYRRELMDRLRLPYRAEAHRVIEIADPRLPPHAQVGDLARQKAESLRDVIPDGLVLASDQGLVFGNVLLGKPGTEEVARRQLTALSGGTYDLVTACSLLDVPTGELHEHTEVYPLVFRALTAAEIRRYVELDQPLDCAGSFRIESLGPALFEAIGGTDPTGIMGMPLMRVVDLLGAFGVSPLAERSS